MVMLSLLEKKLDSKDKAMINLRRVRPLSVEFEETLDIVLVQTVNELNNAGRQAKITDVINAFPITIKSIIRSAYDTFAYDKIIKDKFQELKKGRRIVALAYNGPFELDKYYKQALEQYKKLKAR